MSKADATRFTTVQILSRVRGTFETTIQGQNELASGNELEQQISGLKTAVTQGRSVTLILQKLSTPLGRPFEAWYESLVAEMRADSLMQHFKTLRDMILKEGLPRPIHADAYYWRLGHFGEMTPVTVEEGYYGLVLREVGSVHSDRDLIRPSLRSEGRRITNIRLPNPPRYHLGEELDTDNFVVLLIRYTEFLRTRVVQEAFSRFSPRDA